jgi:hypothetical protein
MSDNVSTLPERGKTFSGGTPTSVDQSVGIEGSRKLFRDEYRSGNGVKVKRSNSQIEGVLVRNSSGAALTPGRTVSWTAAYRWRRVSGYTTTTAQEVAGVVDDQLPSAGVASNDLFWLLRRGPCLVKTPLAGDAGNVFAEGDILVALTAVTSGATTAGRPGVLASAATTNTAAAILNVYARVMSARTTAQTATDMLVNLTLV